MGTEIAQVNVFGVKSTGRFRFAFNLIAEIASPNMDGVETLKQARKISDYYRDAAIVALTGNVSATARDEYLCLGFTDYLEKPVIPDKMEEIIRTYIV